MSVLLAGCSDDDDNDSGRSVVGVSVEEILNNLDEYGELQRGRDYVFTGEITSNTLKRVLLAVPDCILKHGYEDDANLVTLDFSRCTGSNIRWEDGPEMHLSIDAAIKRIVFPAGLTKVPDGFASEYDLRGCEQLKSVVILNGTTSIGAQAFGGCENLTSITIPNSVTSIGKWAFCACLSLTSITIPDSVTSIGDEAFSGCYELRSVNIPDGITSIGARTFSDCKELRSITIPDSVTIIKEAAFDRCYKLQSITIPSSVTSVGQYAFVGWEDTQTIIVHWGAGDTKPAGWDANWYRNCHAKVINADNNNKELTISNIGEAQG